MTSDITRAKSIYKEEGATTLLQKACQYARQNFDRKVSTLYYSSTNDSVDIMDEDWDTIVIVDGCRYDLFLEANSLEGQLESRTSLGSATPEFLTKTFKNKQYHDTIYVTSNPMHRIQELDDVFYDVIDVWESHWDSEYRTVQPAAMADETVKAHEKFPDKRIISHFMQPHFPFIGRLAEKIGAQSGFELTYRKVTEGDSTRDHPTVWEQLERGELERELVWDAYRENLEVALPHIKRLHDALDGKTVVTSDHGNLLGERPHPLANPVYGHPPGFRHPGLNEVPWLVLPYEHRRTITADEPECEAGNQSEEVMNRLADLGYADL